MQENACIYANNYYIQHLKWDFLIYSKTKKLQILGFIIIKCIFQKYNNNKIEDYSNIELYKQLDETIKSFPFTTYGKC